MLADCQRDRWRVESQVLPVKWLFSSVVTALFGYLTLLTDIATCYALTYLVAQILKIVRLLNLFDAYS
jgi:hypothetical protein